MTGVVTVVVYADLVFLLNFLVDFLLLAGTNRLAGYPIRWGRSLLAAGLGGAYGVICLLDGFTFLGSLFWRMVSLGLLSAIAFGWNRSAVSRGILFSFLCMALGGIAMSVHSTGFFAILLCAVAALALCFAGFRGKSGQAEYVQVELTRDGRKKRITALRDTGNTLSDPVTGQQVLVAGPDIAWEFAGLLSNQLQSPIETMAAASVPGLRLIPYRAVGQSGGMLLAVKFDRVTVDGKECSPLVAFAPEQIGRGEAYEALAGGSL